MNLPPFSYILAGVLSVGYLLLMGVVAFNRSRRWLLVTLLTALLAQAIHIVHPLANEGPYAALFIGGVTQPALAVYLTALFLAFFGGFTFRYLKRPGAIVWLLIGLVWWASLIVVSFFVFNRALLGQPEWFGQAFAAPLDAPSALAILGWAVIGFVALLSTFAAYTSAHLPEVASRVLFWLVVTPLVMIGAALGVSGNDALKQAGWIVQFVGMLGAVYAALAYRVMDVRRVVRLGLGSILLTIVTAGLIFVALIVGRGIDPAVDNGLLVLALLAVVGALIYMPIRGVFQSVANRAAGRSSDDSAQVARRYSQDIAGVVELDELVDVAMNTLRDSLRVKRGGLLLATRDDNDTIRLEPMSKGMGDIPEVKGWMPKDSQPYKVLFDRQSTLLQFDLEYSRDYANVAPELKSFFKQLRMGAYAPIIVQGQLSGVLAVGQKGSDDPFNPRDLEVLATIANQTGVSLRNARLVNDLRKASEEMQSLNKDLVQTKDRLEKLDSVKTDFVTVASHELRTPLAQIRGYTDILDALNDQGMLNPDQVGGMTVNLRKATDRLERLIGDMLDVSQLDTDAMDLRFAQTTAENVLRLAIEPLTESIKQRKLTLVARGLRGLPPIEADMQRLVQAFRNVVLNAIKFTPDGGQIGITANLQKNDSTGNDEIKIAIQDTGIGIDPRNQELIFEKFFRVSDPGLHSTGTTKFMGAGPGLGLTIARGVIGGHGGRIWVESTGHDPQKLPGSTFYIVLPVSPPEGAKRVTPFEQPQVAAAR